MALGLFFQVRALAAATISALLDGPAQRGILSVAEAKSMSARAPVRGFLTLSLSLGQLLLAAHTGLLHAVANESSMLVLPGVLRTLVVLIQASPYERLPQELLPETFKVLQTRWAELTAASLATASVRGGELGPSQTAYLACLAECFSTKQPVAGLATFLSQQQQQTFQDFRVPESQHGSAGCVSTQHLVRDLLAVGQDASVEAVRRIEALAALKGLAVNYTTALPPDVWHDLRATAAMGLSCIPAVRSPPASRSGPPSRSSSWSSLGAVTAHAASGRPGDRAGLRAPASQAFGPGAFSGAAVAGAVSQAASSPITPSANSSPEDKAAQLSVRLLSDYLSAIARQYGIVLTDSAGAGSGDDGLSGLPPSPGFVPLAAAVARQQQQPLSPVCVRSEEQRKAGLQRLASMWQDAVAVLVPAATSHQSYMVRSAGLSCLSEVPEPVFSSLTCALQQQLLTLLSDAAASDAVAAVRAAACKALGAAAVFPAVLETPQLSDHITRALLPSLRDSVLSVRIAAGWAIANLCDAYRRRLEALANGEGSDTEQQLRSRVDSHAHASTSSYGGGSGAVSFHTHLTLSLATVPLEPHHYRQLAALCGAAIISTQDTDKVRANGVRAVGNLLAFLTPDMAPGLMAAGAPSGGATAGGSLVAVRGDPSAVTSACKAALGDAPSAAVGDWSGQQGGRNLDSKSSPSSLVSHVRGTNTSTGDSSDGMQLDVWLDNALTCLQSTLTTGGIKAQWNACYAMHGLLRNPRLLVHPSVSLRIAPLLLLLVMLVRESANFKIRTHAAAALAALPSREAYGDVLLDALVVVASALESMSGDGGSGGTGVAATATMKTISSGADKGGADGDGDGDGNEGRFPNYRYMMGLSTQLRATLLHLLALAQPADARRVRKDLVRRAGILHACLREQIAEATQPLRALSTAAHDCCGGWTGREDSGYGGIRGVETGVMRREVQGSRASDSQVEVDLPADPFGLCGGLSTANGASAARGLAGLLAGLGLGNEQADHVNLLQLNRDPSGASQRRDLSIGTTGVNRAGYAEASDGGGGKPRLTVLASSGTDDELLQRAWDRVGRLAAPLQGLATLLAQLGPLDDPLLQDVQQALALLHSS
ncbi:hypothetical protein Vafri_1091 [Volvox africanus]|nr:hypothetical protein Vafri_1091 [Volvox africanus]